MIRKDDYGCRICGRKINLLPGPGQQETSFHEHHLVHTQCLRELEEKEEFELYMSVFDHVPSPVEVLTHCYKPFKTVPNEG